MRCIFLYIVGQLSAGGAERQLNYLLHALDRDRYRPEVVVWNFREEDTYVSHLKKIGIPLHPLSPGGSATAKLGEVRRLVRKIEPEVVHSYSFFTNVVAWWGTLGSHAVPVGSIRGDFVNERWRSGNILGRLSARFPDTIIANSRLGQEAAGQHNSLFRPRNVLVVRNGMNLSQFSATPVPNGAPIILGIGRLEPLKRWDLLLAAVADLSNRGVNACVRLVGDGPSAAELRQLATDLGIASRVEFMGLRSDVPAQLSQATLLAHAADTEGCPNAVMEAMACGRAVVATDAGDVPDLVSDGVTGFVVGRGDYAALTDRLETLLADHEQCVRMGTAGRAQAEQLFGLDRLTAEVCAAYQKAGWRR